MIQYFVSVSRKSFLHSLGQERGACPPSGSRGSRIAPRAAAHLRLGPGGPMGPVKRVDIKGGWVYAIHQRSTNLSPSTSQLPHIGPCWTLSAIAKT